MVRIVICYFLLIFVLPIFPDVLQSFLKPVALKSNVEAQPNIVKWLKECNEPRSVYIPANKNPILKLDGNLNFLKTYPKKDRNTLLYWFSPIW